MSLITNNYFLPTYQVTCSDFLTPPLLIGCVGFPWAKQHWELAEKEPSSSLGHKVIACFEALPVIGGLFVLIERIVAAVASYWQTQPSSVSHPIETAEVGTPEKAKNDANFLFRAKQNERGSQEGCIGNIAIEKTNEVCRKLQQNPAPGISFDSASYKEGSTIIGTCTAMSLKFASTYIGLREELNEISPESEPFLDRLRLLKDDFETSSEEMRSKQMAYSSIKVDRSVDMDISRNKIESCVRGHDFEIDLCSNEIEMSENKDLWEKELNSLPNGIYFVRMLKASDNCKLEARAHSMIYVREENVAYFYDNNCGLEKLSTASIPIYERLLSVHQKWDIPSTRLYLLNIRKI